MDSDVSIVIEKTALIENLVDQIIHKYTTPRKEAFQFFWEILLDSSIMPLGSKLRVVMAISQTVDVKLKQDPLHKVISFRNAFAHHSLHSHATVEVGKTSEEDKSYYMLQIISSSGKTNRISRENALKCFEVNFKKAHESLLELNEAVISHVNP